MPPSLLCLESAKKCPRKSCMHHLMLRLKIRLYKDVFDGHNFQPFIFKCRRRKFGELPLYLHTFRNSETWTRVCWVQSENAGIRATRPLMGGNSDAPCLRHWPTINFRFYNHWFHALWWTHPLQLQKPSDSAWSPAMKDEPIYIFLCHIIKFQKNVIQWQPCTA